MRREINGHQGATFYTKRDVSYFLKNFMNHCQRNKTTWSSVDRKVILTIPSASDPPRNHKTESPRCKAKTVTRFLKNNNLFLSKQAKTTNSVKAGDLTASLYYLSLSIASSGVSHDFIVNFDQTPTRLFEAPTNVVTTSKMPHRVDISSSDLKESFTVIPCVFKWVC